MSDHQDTTSLQARVEQLEKENAELRAQLAASTGTMVSSAPDSSLSSLSSSSLSSSASTSGPAVASVRTIGPTSAATTTADHKTDTCSTAVSTFQNFVSHSLDPIQIQRYGRHLILSQIGVPGQENICKARVLVIGAGGLGAPACLYLAAAGIGKLGIIDGDTVDRDNLHRQVIHSEETLGMPKAESARDACLRINSSITCDAIVASFTSNNAMEIAAEYDVLVDATDNVGTRYLINDVGVILGKPVVSGSALGTDGQLNVFGYNGGPCYRCIHPVPPPPETVTNCADGGVLGVVPGIIGCLQALEVIKVVGGLQNPTTMRQRLLIFDAMSNRFMNVKLRPRNPECAVCGDNPTVTAPIDYAQFCGSALTDTPEDPDDTNVPSTTRVPSIGIREYASEIHGKDVPHVLVDVRDDAQFGICSLPKAIHIPLAKLTKRDHESKAGKANREAVLKQIHDLATATTPPLSVYMLCRRGVRSKVATKSLLVEPLFADIPVLNVRGGLFAYHRKVDSNMPLY
jgi:adenylyltransferase and sulfurtransferase